MRKALVVLALAGLAAGAIPARGAPPTATSPATRSAPSTRTGSPVAARPVYVPGEVVVRFRAGVSRSRSALAHAALGARVARRVDGTRFEVVRLPRKTSVARAVRSYSADPAVASAEPNKLIYPAVDPNDPIFDDQWGLHNTGQSHPLSGDTDTGSGSPDADIDAAEAWDDEDGTAGTVIAILDSGVQLSHPDLNDNIWINGDEVPGNGIDDDGNGYIDDIKGWDFATNDASLLQTKPNDPAKKRGFEHGTHVAGIAAAEYQNGTGIAGVCPECSIMVLKFMKPVDTDGDDIKDTMVGTLSAELEALAYARRNGADILNGSFTSALWSQSERDAFKKLGKDGVLAVLAAGNSSLDNDMFLSGGRQGSGIGLPGAFSPEYPASYSLNRIISVTASQHADRYGYNTLCARSKSRRACAFASWGHDSVDVAAPGVDITSTVPGGYETFDGTSMAAPHVAGAAGLVESKLAQSVPPVDASVLDLKNAILNSVGKPGNLDKIYAFRGGARRGRFTRTNGRVNAANALTASTGPAYDQTDGNIDGAKRIRRTRRGRVKWPKDVNDVYKKRLRKGKRYRVVLDGARRKDFDLVVWKPKTDEIWQVERGCLGGRGGCQLKFYNPTDSADESARFKAKKRGTYYFQVSAWLLNKGRYSLKVKRV